MCALFNNDSITNSTAIEEDGLGILIYHYGIFALITCINIPGNLLVILTFVRHDSLREPSNYYIIGLAASDLCTGFVYPTYVISHINHEAIRTSLGNWKVCRFIITEILALEICSSYHLVAITVTRYIAIVKPLRSHLYVTKKVSLIAMAAIWLFSQSICFAVYYSHQPENYDNQCRYEKLFTVKHVTILFVIQLFLPLGVMLGLYLKIAKIARRQARVMSVQDRGMDQKRNSQNSFIGRERKSTVMVALLLCCFASGWIPMVIYFYFDLTCKGCITTPYIRATARNLLYLNSAVNVFVYAGRLGTFRRAVKQDMRRFFRKR